VRDIHPPAKSDFYPLSQPIFSAVSLPAGARGAFDADKQPVYDCPPTRMNSVTIELRSHPLSLSTF